MGPDHVATDSQQRHRDQDHHRSEDPLPRRAWQPAPPRPDGLVGRFVGGGRAVVGLVDARIVKLHGLGLDVGHARSDAGDFRYLGGLFLDIGGLLSLTAEPDRPRPCAGGGGNRVRFSGLGFGLVGQRERLLRIRGRLREPRWFVGAVGVNHRIAAPERRHTDLLV